MSTTQFKVENYLPNSFIMVEGKKNPESFYIILKGKVKLSKENPLVGDTTIPILGPGDFFGVISCMSTHARMETAVSLENTSVIAVKKDQFGDLIQRNPDVAMKIIRFFSKKLRYYDQSITHLTLKTTAEETPEHLYKIGEYYLSKKQYQHAAYAFQRYLQYCPTGESAEKSLYRLKQLKAPFKVQEQPTDGLIRSYKDNTMLFCENEYGFELFIIQAGQVKITKIVGEEEVLLAVLKAGDIFGEMALLDNKLRSATAISFGETKVMVITKDNFESTVISQPQLATRLIVLLSERIWTAARQLENLTIKDPLGRIYDTLLIQIEKQKINIRPKMAHNFQFGLSELFNMIGMNKTKNEALTAQIFSEKLITIDGGKIICQDVAELEKIANIYKKKSFLDRKREASKNS